MRRPKNFHKMETGAFQLEGTHSLHILTPTGGVLATIDEDGIAQCVSVGLEHRVTVSDTAIEIATDGPVWRVDNALQQNREQGDEKYTTYDRPAPLSPEMQAIQRLARQNEIERDKLRKRLETYEKREVAPSMVAENDPNPPSGQAKRSQATPEEPEREGDSPRDGADPSDPLPDPPATPDQDDP